MALQNDTVEKLRSINYATAHMIEKNCLSHIALKNMIKTINHLLNNSDSEEFNPCIDTFLIE